ncbi:hypothetical protein QQX98_010150 [Neonectria punicea]|uniref:Uncharacterized protein n=1 Tax=Neonectria punicea TaxID=979145 RepID=A0ABR1GQ89_9HYPO
MKPGESVYFNTREYASKLERLVACQKINEIREREVLKNRQIYAAYTKMGIGAILFVPTAGMSAITSALSFRQLLVACQKLQVIKSILVKYGITLHECGYRDRVIPIVTNILTAGIGFGCSFLLSDIAATGIEGAAAQGVYPVAHTGIASSAVADPAAFVGGFVHGVEAQLDSVSAALSPGDVASNVTQAALENAVPLSVGAEFFDGGHTGFTAAAIVERFLVQEAIATSLQNVADGHARNRLHRRIAEESQTADERQRELGEVHEALHAQYVNLMTAHSKLLRNSKSRHPDVAALGGVRDRVMAWEERARDDRSRAEECQKARFVSQFEDCLKKWENTIKKQAGAQAEWQMIIDKGKRA